MKSKVILYYKRPAKIEKNAKWQDKPYTWYTSALSSAIDSALRLALDGYAVRIEVDGVTVLDWSENFIEALYRF